MVDLRADCLRFCFPAVHQEAACSISFQRTLRIPDDNRSHPLPPGLDRFPLYPVDYCGERLPTRWREHGGIFMPLYQAEALWVSFEFPGYPMAIKVAAGKVDALTGEPFRNGLTERPQDYLVIPGQPWLDGFCVQEGLIRQFVAMPLGEGYTAEEQLTGTSEHGGLQIVVYPMKADRYAELKRHEVLRCDLDMLEALSSGPQEMGLAPGGLMRQEIFEDSYGFDVWDQEVRSRCFVHLLNSAQFCSVTGAAPPHEPPNAKEYNEAGLPWFEYYDAERTALGGAPRLARIDSLAVRRLKEGAAPLEADTGGEPGREQIVPLGPKPHRVREGSDW